MNRIISRLLTVSIIAVLWSLSGCDDSSETIDTTAPSIEVADPVNGEYFAAGTFAHFEASFTDNTELGSYNISIHNNFDGHSHGRIAETSDDPSLFKWSYNESFEFATGLKNSDVQLHDEIEIPQNTLAGPYHFIVTAVDKSGNATSYQDDSTVEIEIFITNNSQPAISITNLENDELEIEVGQVFMVTGAVSDPTTGEYAGMHALEVVLGEDHNEAHDHSHGRIAEDDLIDFDIEEENLESYMEGDAIILEKVFEEINFTLSQDQLNDLIAEDVDHLELTIRVHDEQGNIAISKTPVHVHSN